MTLELSVAGVDIVGACRRCPLARSVPAIIAQAHFKTKELRPARGEMAWPVLVTLLHVLSVAQPGLQPKRWREECLHSYGAFMELLLDKGSSRLIIRWADCGVGPCKCISIRFCHSCFCTTMVCQRQLGEAMRLSGLALKFVVCFLLGSNFKNLQ